MNDITKQRTDIPNSAMLSSYKADSAAPNPDLNTLMEKRLRERFTPPKPEEEVVAPKKGWFARLIDRIKGFFKK